MLKQIITVVLFLICFKKINAQLLFYQDTYRGGVTSDGVSYYDYEYLQADTIDFQTYIMPGSIVKKAFLLSFRGNFFVGSSVSKDNPLIVFFNNQPISFDSSLILTKKFTTFSGAEDEWIVGADVTQFTQLSGNKLIVPCQTCLMLIDTSRHYVYDGFVLVIMYENALLSSVNASIVLNHDNMASSMVHQITGINPIINTSDVGLSIWSTNVSSWPLNSAMSFALNSSLGTFALGTLDQHYMGGWKKTLPGSFYYENNSLFGLMDDTNDPVIDSTDALANIKTFLVNGTTSFSLTSNIAVNAAGTRSRNGFILAYATTCPERAKSDSLFTYTICQGDSQTLSVASINSGISYTWYASDGSLASASTPSVIVTPTVSANYIAYVDSAGCKHTEHFKVNVFPIPKTDSVQITNAICGDDRGIAAIVPPTSGEPYTYDIGGGSQASNAFSNLNPGAYSYTVTNFAGCRYSNAFTITEINPAQGSFSFTSAAVCINVPVNFFNVSGGTNFQWWSFSLNDTSIVNNPTHIFSDTGYYNVTLIAWYNLPHCSDTITKPVYVSECPPDSLSITTPNIFTPNGDEINDVWFPHIFDIGYTFIEYELIIYDRWGIKVFESARRKAGWDGFTTSGASCVAGTYYYVVKYIAASTSGKRKEGSLKGFLQLMR